MDDILIERLWRSIKYKEVYQKMDADGREDRASIGRSMDFYNARRPHHAISNHRPVNVRRDGVDSERAAGNCGYDVSLGRKRMPTAGVRGVEKSGLKIFTKRKRRETAGAYIP
jgi:hypothetical protein